MTFEVRKVAPQRQKPKNVIRAVLSIQGEATAKELMKATGLGSTQAVLYHLRQMITSGEIAPVGGGPSTRYRIAVTLTRTYKTKGLEEHVAWRELKASLPRLAELPSNVQAILNYSVTEMLNNAIDHSGSTDVTVAVDPMDNWVAIEVSDRGIGAFRHVKEQRGMASLEDAVLAISKGKMTTAPEAHTGEGIFFTSKVVDRFDLEANGIRWVVDNAVNDQAIGVSKIASGTRVRFRVATNSTRRMDRTFDEFTIDGEFARTVQFVKLVDRGEEFISRSEAKRIASGLERFSEAILDFSGVALVGQGFADELFRVWAASNPHVVLKPIGMAESVENIVLRAIPKASSQLDLFDGADQGTTTATGLLGTSTTTFDIESENGHN